MPVVTLLNQKGGVGKTSTCHHLAGALAVMGRRVLLVDNDPQSSLTQGLIGPEATRGLAASETLASIYRGDRPFPEQVIRPTTVAGVDLVAGSRSLYEQNMSWPESAPYDTQTCLRAFLEEVAGRYDFVLIDSPPNLLLCSWVALVASDALVVPLQPEDYGAQGIADVADFCLTVGASGLSPTLSLMGFLITMHSPRRSIHKLYEGQLRGTYGRSVFRTMVPYAADYPEAIAARKPISVYKPKAKAAEAMAELAREVIERSAAATSTTEAA